MSADDARPQLKETDPTRMAGLSSVERVRERAAECRARAEHPILQADAAEWLQLADTWDRLADAIETSADQERVEQPRSRFAEGHGRPERSSSGKGGP